MGVGGLVGSGEEMMPGVQYQTSRRAALLQPQMLKEVSLMSLELQLRQMELRRDSRRGIEGAQIVFGDVALANEVSLMPLHFLSQMPPSQILLLPEHVR